MDLAELQDDVIARGFTRDFGDNDLLISVAMSDLHVVGSISFDGGTDPGDDATMYLIEAREENGYLLLSDSFHNSPQKTAFINALLSRTSGKD